MTDEEKRRIAENIRQARYPYKQIGIEAQLRDVPEKVILEAIGLKSKKGIPYYNSWLRLQPEPAPEPQNVETAPKRARHRLTQSQMDRIARMYFYEKKTQREIADATGCGQSTVSGILKEYKGKGKI